MYVTGLSITILYAGYCYRTLKLTAAYGSVLEITCEDFMR